MCQGRRELRRDATRVLPSNPAPYPSLAVTATVCDPTPVTLFLQGFQCLMEGQPEPPAALQHCEEMERQQRRASRGVRGCF